MHLLSSCEECGSSTQGKMSAIRLVQVPTRFIPAYRENTKYIDTTDIAVHPCTQGKYTVFWLIRYFSGSSPQGKCIIPSWRVLSQFGSSQVWEKYFVWPLCDYAVGSSPVRGIQAASHFIR